MQLTEVFIIAFLHINDFMIQNKKVKIILNDFILTIYQKHINPKYFIHLSLIKLSTLTLSISAKTFISMSVTNLFPHSIR